MQSYRKELESLKKKKLFRKKRGITRQDFPFIKIKEKKLVDFSSNNYLGLAGDKVFQKKALLACTNLAPGAGGSPLLSGESQTHLALEEKLAAWKKTESALLFASGYQANVAAVTALAGRGDTLYLDKLCHASLIDGAKLSGARLRIFKHKNLSDLEALLKTHRSGTALVISDGVFSMDGDMANLSGLIKLKKKYKSKLLIDDAHGTGVLGKKGGGSVEYFQVSAKDIDAQTGTFSKAFGAQGGYLCCNKVVASLILNKARAYIYSTALSPWLCKAASLALDEIKKGERTKILQENISFLKIKLGLPEHKTAIFPLLIGDEKKTLHLSEKLQRQGYFLPALRFPTVAKRQARLRISLSSAHTEKQISSLVKALKKSGAI